MADRTETEALITGFFNSLEVRDIAGALARVGEDVVHDTFYGEREIGWESFERYLIHRSRCYRTEYDALVVMSDPSGHRAAAEFVLKVQYLVDDDRLGPDAPQAADQQMAVAAGVFFEVDDERITRVSATFDSKAALEQLGA